MDIVKFFQEAQKLKGLVRAGWAHKKVPNPESVADHSYGVALLATIMPLPKGLDRDKLIRMAIFHDLAEVRVGDIVWERGRVANLERQEKKYADEKEAYEHLASLIKNTDVEKLGKEYLDMASPEAQFLKELDKLEMIFQALAYEEHVPPHTLDEFWENVDKYLKSKECRAVFEQLKELRQGSR